MAVFDFQVTHNHPNFSAERLHLLIELRDARTSLSHSGFRETSRAGNIIAGSIPTESLHEYKQEPAVLLVESTRQIKDELDDSIVAIRLRDSADVRQIPSRGQGAIIGVIDSGFELTHPCFRDDEGRTRILSAWDQIVDGKTTGRSPKEFGYGTEYAQTEIDEFASKGQTLLIKNDSRAGSHGTAVAGIAAGNGVPFGIYEGMAPEAKLILVSYRNDVPIGGSAFILDAISYILRVAKSQRKPVVINLSQGDNLGAHDGSSLLERAIDYLLANEPLLIVNSAGNGRGGQRHTQGRLYHDNEHFVQFTFTKDQVVDDDTIDLWYAGTDRFSLAVKTPAGYQSEFVPAGCEAVINFPGGGTAHVYSEIDFPTNHDNRISIVFGNRERWEPGEWAIVLRGDLVRNGMFHAWTDRPNAVSAITFTNPSDDYIVTLPGTAHHIITVTGFVSRPVNADAGRTRGELAGGTSFGPTRDARLKPDLTGPSSMIMAPRLTGGVGGMPLYAPNSGTSMAAPHVTGIIALVWALKPSMEPKEIRAALYTSAAADQFTKEVPNFLWGRGKADASGLYHALFNV